MKQKLNIGFIGNFSTPHSTEQDRKWSFEKLGHNVITFQENQTTSSILKSFLPRLDMLVYSHTHGWEIPGLKEVFVEAKKQGIPTVSVHLDRWAWLDRESDIGKEATWFTEYIFMADASPEAVELYKKHNLNWFYIKPGVIERDCYMTPREDWLDTKHAVNYKNDVIFVGSKNYHQEYLFRPEMIDFLKKTYGDNFQHYGNDGVYVVRGDSLNQVYASAKVVVGDSCFGGRPNYVSDRYYETRGRGGFLLHPKTEGVDSVGVGHYDRGSLESLKEMIDYYLEKEDERESMRLLGFNHVKENETYTNRAEEILKVVFG